jgi:hypothetical protein
MSEPKIYAGSAKEKQLQNGKLIKLSLKLDVLVEAAKEHGFDAKAGRMIKVDVWEKREADQYGNTHDIVVDTWKPNPSYQQTQPNTPAPAPAPNPAPPAQPEEGIDGIPF